VKIELEPIGIVRSTRDEAIDDRWDEVRSRIELDAARFTPEALAGLDTFSHLVVVYAFHKTDPAKTEFKARYPRGNTAWPKVGIFAQRGKDRPNHLGVSACAIHSVQGLMVEVRGLDAIDGTPVLDLKPYMLGFEPRGSIREPDWAREIMKEYW
jgi:tRNA-Thr(GGU) m(6)t(6)A37 methyltransferase TsaA